MTPPVSHTSGFITTKTSNHSAATTVTAHKLTERNETMSTRAYPTSRKLIDLLGDVAIISLTYIVLALLLVNRQALATHIILYSGMLPLAVVLSIGLFIIYGLYTLQYKRFSEIIISLFVSLIAVFFIIMAISFLFNYSYYSRILLISSTVVQFILLIIWKRIWQKYEQSLHPERNVMIIGGEKECRHVYFRMNAQPQLKLHLKHVIMNETEKWRDVADLHDVDCIIICSDVPIQTRADIVYYCMDNDIQPYVIPDSYEIIANGAMLRKIDDIPVFRPRSLQLSIEQRAGKRVMDLLFAGIAAICALPIAAIVALAIKLEDHGPVLYSQVRIGRFGVDYKVYKFRSMRVDAEKYSGPQLATENDPRITKVGKFIRATRLDEIPQIWNVLNGDMSLVGPRPERPYFVEQFVEEYPEYSYRHNVKPGITGLAQVFAKYNTTPYDKLVYDLMYIENFSLIQDLVIMVHTVKIIFTKSATEGAVDINKLTVDFNEIEKVKSGR